MQYEQAEATPYQTQLMVVQVARGERPADLILRNGTLVNVFTGELYVTDVAIAGGRIAGLGAGYAGAREIDLRGRYLCPGFIDGHMHVETSMVTVPQFARAVVRRGTTTVVLDPHEIANVHGVAGIRYILDSRRGVPLSVFVMLSSAVPATQMETAGAELDADALAPLYAEDGVLGLAELMNYPGVVAGDPCQDPRGPGGAHADRWPRAATRRAAAERLRRGGRRLRPRMYQHRGGTRKAAAGDVPDDPRGQQRAQPGRADAGRHPPEQPPLHPGHGRSRPR